MLKSSAERLQLLQLIFVRPSGRPHAARCIDGRHSAGRRRPALWLLQLQAFPPAMRDGNQEPATTKARHGTGEAASGEARRPKEPSLSTSGIATAPSVPHGRRGGLAGGRAGERRDGRIEREMQRQTDGRPDGRTDGQTNGQEYGGTCRRTSERIGVVCAWKQRSDPTRRIKRIYRTDGSADGRGGGAGVKMNGQAERRKGGRANGHTANRTDGRTDGLPDGRWMGGSLAVMDQ